MKIKITAGTFGHRIGERVVAVKAGDPPIEVTDAIGRRLLSCGVAVAVEPEANEPTKNVDEGAETAKAEEFPEYDESMTRAELESIARSVGIEDDELKAAAKKADVIELLDEAREDFEAEDAPTFDPAGDML